MKKIQGLFANVLTIALLLILIGGLVITLNRITPDDNQPPGELTAQKAQQESPIATPTLLPEIKASPIPPPLSETTEPDFEIPVEPTWTPVIIMPEGTPPLIPTPLPTSTATPVNPGEKLINSFDVFVDNLAISPDDQVLAMSVRIESSEKKEISSEIWIIDLDTRRVKQLNVFGSNPIWSPDGKNILFQSGFDEETIEIRTIDRYNENVRSIAKVKNDELLGYEWLSDASINIRKTDGIAVTDLSGKEVERTPITIPVDLNGLSRRYVAQAENGDLIILDRPNNKLLISTKDGRIVETITDTENSNVSGRAITEFILSNNGDALVYVINEGPNNELWYLNLTEVAPKRVFRWDFGNVRHIVWSPDDQGVLVGWGESGTDVPTKLTWFNLQTGESVPLGVHGVGLNPIISHSGQKIFFRRVFLDENRKLERTEIYELEFKQ